MTELEIETLAQSAEEQNWGFSGGLSEVQAQPLLNVRLPRWMARQWTVTTLAMRYSGRGALVAPDFLPGSPDNQVNTVEGGATHNLQPFQMTLNWGNGGVQETAQIDYPFAGNTFSFFASQFQLSLNNLDPASVSLINALGRPPRLGAFVCPSAGRWQELGAGPLWTTHQFAVECNSDGPPIYVPIPPRARAYRISVQGNFTDAAGNSLGLVVQQVTGVQGAYSTLAFDRGGPGAAPSGGIPNGETYFALQDIYVDVTGTITEAGIWAQRLKNNVGILESGASGLYMYGTVTSGGGQPEMLVTVQFALDLG